MKEGAGTSAGCLFPTSQERRIAALEELPRRECLVTSEICHRGLVSEDVDGVGAPHVEPANENVLRVGIDVSWYPYMRVERARSLLLSLVAETRGWSRSGAAIGWLRETSDPTRLELYLEVRREPPLDDWSMRVGEAVHHLRASLDGLAWDIAHLNDSAPRNPKVVDFPACSQDEAWSRVTAKNGWLASVAGDIVERIRKVQPMTDPNGFVAQAHRLDIVDKHRGLLGGTGQVAGFRLANVTLDGGLEPETLEHRVELVPPGVLLQDGTILAYMVLNQSMESGGILSNGPLPIEVDFVIGEGDESRTLYELAHQMPDEALEVIDFVCTGYEGLKTGEDHKGPRPLGL